MESTTSALPAISGNRETAKFRGNSFGVIFHRSTVARTEFCLQVRKSIYGPRKVFITEKSFIVQKSKITILKFRSEISIVMRRDRGHYTLVEFKINVKYNYVENKKMPLPLCKKIYQVLFEKKLISFVKN